MISLIKKMKANQRIFSRPARAKMKNHNGIHSEISHDRAFSRGFRLLLAPIILVLGCHVDVVYLVRYTTLLAVLSLLTSLTGSSALLWVVRGSNPRRIRVNRDVDVRIEPPIGTFCNTFVESTASVLISTSRTRCTN